MATCIVTILLLPAECSDAELRLDAVILVIRNLLQAVRLFNVIKTTRKHSQIRSQPLDINFDELSPQSPMLPSQIFKAKHNAEVHNERPFI